MNFESKETEDYYYDQTKKYRISHVAFNDKTIVTKNLVDELINTFSKNATIDDYEC